MQIVPNIFLVNGFPYGVHHNHYVVKLGDAWVMVDCGDLVGDTLDLVRANCARWGIHLEDIRYLLTTHSHVDHASHARTLQRLGAKIVANQDCADALASGDERCLRFAYGAFSGKFEPCHVDMIVKDGDEIEIGGHTVRCIEAPGHANSCVIYEMDLMEKRHWFVGDVILTGPECKTVELGWRGTPDYDRGLYVKTLKRLSQLDCDCLFPGHGPPLLGNGKRLVELAYTHAMLDR